MQRLSCSLSHRLWLHLPATSSQPYCLKLDVTLFSDLSEEDKTAEGRVRLRGALHRVRKSLLDKQNDKPELYFAIRYFLSITKGILFLILKLGLFISELNVRNVLHFECIATALGLFHTLQNRGQRTYMF